MLNFDLNNLDFSQIETVETISTRKSTKGAGGRPRKAKNLPDLGYSQKTGKFRLSRRAFVALDLQQHSLTHHVHPTAGIVFLTVHPDRDGVFLTGRTNKDGSLSAKMNSFTNVKMAEALSPSGEVSFKLNYIGDKIKGLPTYALTAWEGVSEFADVEEDDSSETDGVESGSPDVVAEEEVAVGGDDEFLFS
jgi:hypothetical protein